TAAPPLPNSAELQAADGSAPGPAAIAADAPAASEMPSSTTAQATSAAEPATSETSVGAGESAARAPSAAAPRTPRPPSTGAKRTARDDLLPPYSCRSRDDRQHPPSKSAVRTWLTISAH